jgi:hypothetical protein
MKRHLLVLCLGLAPVVAPASAAAPSTPTKPAVPAVPAKPAGPKTETVDLQSKGRVILTLPSGWTAVREDAANPLDLVFKAPAGVNATARITFGFPNSGSYESAAEVRAKVTELGDDEAESSVEKKTVLQTYKLRSGYGYFSSFTDPKLVGKKPVPGDYKTITVGMVRPAPGLVGIVSILCDDLAGPEFRQLQEMIETLEVLGPGGARRRAEF